MQKVYITGSSLISALGNDKKEAINKIKQIDNSNYENYLKENFSNINFYRINQKFSSFEDKFLSIIKQSVKDAIIDANLSKEEIKELHIFIGSTSMSISINEEQYEKYVKKQSSEQIKKIGYGDIGTFIEQLIDAKYKSTIIQTACTSSVNAICYAKDMIKNKEIKRALIVGFEFFNKSTYKGFKSLMLLSNEGKYKPFDKNSDGLILGEGCSSVILDSKKNKDDDFEILSTNNSFDNYSVTSSNPNGEVTSDCMIMALEKASLEIEDLTCLKAHATGSENSNFSEARALDNLFEKCNATTNVVILKPYIGHTLGACGATETVLLCESIKNNYIPKTLNFKESYEDIQFKPLLENVYENQATVLFHYIGFGGSNTSMILSNVR
ncbi:MAG: beta-ketoacyl synthase [Arcobacter sp.]|nr:beta-ketoacyl synthase [Arcobacter sp.]|tara:strand:- start:10414 stop:11562 length:1149 start_codon:yes stop_codon:yes gene_type:complete